MMKAYPIFSDFSAGKASRLIDGRVDHPLYYRALYDDENFAILAQGAATRRPGTQFIVWPKKYQDPDKATIIVPFIYSNVQAYFLEFGDNLPTSNGYIRFFMDAGSGIAPINAPAGGVYELTTTYTHAQLANLRWCQAADVMFLVHPSHPPRILARTAHNAWTLTDATINNGPFMPENVDETHTIRIDSNPPNTPSVVSSKDIFSSGMVGQSLKIRHNFNKQISSISGTFAGIGTAANDVVTTGTTGIITKKSGSKGWVSSSIMEINERGKIHYTLSGGWVGEMVLERRWIGSATWETYRVYTANVDETIDNTLAEDARFRWRCSAYTSGTISWALESLQPIVGEGIVQLSAYVSTKVMNIIFIDDKEPVSYVATSFWSQAAWSSTLGWPENVTFHDNRLVFFGNARNPHGYWTSKVGGFDSTRIDMEGGAEDIHGISGVLLSNEVNAGCWIASMGILCAGTTGGEWRIGPGAYDEVFTPSNAPTRQYGSFGSARIQPVKLPGSLVFVQRHGRRLIELIPREDQQGFDLKDLGIINPDICDDSYIVGLCYQQQPHGIIWAWRNDGKVVGVTHIQGQDVYPHHWHEFGGDAVVEESSPRVKSMAVIPGQNQDVVGLIVHRLHGDQWIQSFEVMSPFWTYNYRSDSADNWKEAKFLDSHVVRSTGGPFTTVSGLSHLNGKTVLVFADGNQQSNKVVAAGSITIDSAYYAVVGLTNTSCLITMRPEIQMPDGTGQGRLKKIGKTVVRLHQSWRGNIGTSRNSTDQMPATAFPAAASNFDGDVEIPAFPQGFNTDCRIAIVQHGCYPMTILAIMPEVEIGR